MPNDTFSTFPAADVQTWINAAKKELGGKDPFTALTTTKHHLIIKPYYTAVDTDNLPELNLKPSSDPYLGPRSWYNSPMVQVRDEIAANKKALEHLNMGADGIIFQILSSANLEKLLSNIELRHCSIYFRLGTEQAELVDDFHQYVNVKGFDVAQITGGLFWQNMNNGNYESLNAYKGWDKFKVAGNVISALSDPVEEIVTALMSGVKIISDRLDCGHDKEDIFTKMAFSFSIGTDFFMEIAKLKTFRRLWSLIQLAYKVPDSDILIHGFSPEWNQQEYQPNANMLKSTTAAMSAILGGCDIITLEPEAGDIHFKARIARNALSILREESHLNQTADPTAGSYYLESLVDQMAQKCWKEFQMKVTA